MAACHALLVTADPAVRQAFELALAGLDLRMTVAVAHTGVAAVVDARRRPPALMLVDSQLEDVTGAEALQWLRAPAMLRDRPTLFLTDRPGTQLEMPRCITLRKPVSLSRLRAVLPHLLSMGVPPAEGAGG